MEGELIILTLSLSLELSFHSAHILRLFLLIRIDLEKQKPIKEIAINGETRKTMVKPFSKLSFLTSLLLVTCCVSAAVPEASSTSHSSGTSHHDQASTSTAQIYQEIEEHQRIEDSDTVRRFLDDNSNSTNSTVEGFGEEEEEEEPAPVEPDDMNIGCIVEGGGPVNFENHALITLTLIPSLLTQGDWDTVAESFVDAYNDAVNCTNNEDGSFRLLSEASFVLDPELLSSDQPETVALILTTQGSCIGCDGESLFPIAQAEVFNFTDPEVNPLLTTDPEVGEGTDLSDSGTVDESSGNPDETGGYTGPNGDGTGVGAFNQDDPLADETGFGGTGAVGADGTRQNSGFSDEYQDAKREKNTDNTDAGPVDPDEEFACKQNTGVPDEVRLILHV